MLTLDMDGTFTANGQMYHIREISSYKLSQRDFDISIPSSEFRASKYKESSLIVLKSDYTSQFVDVKYSNSSVTCGTTDKNLIARRIHSNKMRELEVLVSKFEKRAAEGCPTRKVVLPMGVAADCSYVARYGGPAAALKQILSNWNQASKLYERTYNIQLGVSKVLLQEKCTPEDPQLKWNVECTAGYTIANRLSDFSAWRGNQGSDTNGLWHLMTRCR
jgi:hypothetical protein